MSSIKRIKRASSNIKELFGFRKYFVLDQCDFDHLDIRCSTFSTFSSAFKTFKTAPEKIFVNKQKQECIKTWSTEQE